MTIVQGFIHADGAPGRNHGYLDLVASTALKRPAGFFGGLYFFVAADAFVVVYIHDFLLGCIFKPHKHGGHSFHIQYRIFFGQMASRTVFASFFKGTCVLLMKKCHPRPLKVAEVVHGIDVNDISPDFRRLLRLGVDSKNRGAVH